MKLTRVLVQFEDGTEHVITGEIIYERTTTNAYPWEDISIRVRNGRTVLGASQPDRIDLAPCHACGAPQGPLVLSTKGSA